MGADVDFIDRGKVHVTGIETCVRYGCLEDALVIAEFNVQESNAKQLKYFGPGVGNVSVGWSGDDAGQEELELVSVTRLDRTARREVQAAALELEAHAYEISGDVYGRTEPAE